MLKTYKRAEKHTHSRLTALLPELPRSAGTRKVKSIWILLKQETVSGSGISWATCKSASRSRQITMPAPYHSKFFTGRMPFLPPNQQRQSTEGTCVMCREKNAKKTVLYLIHTNQLSSVQSNNKLMMNF